MGSEIVSSSERRIRTDVVAEDTIDQVDIIKNGRLWVRETCATEPNTMSYRAKVRIEWGYGREHVTWRCAAHVIHGRLRGCTPYFGPPGDDRLTEIDSAGCRWQSQTFGNPWFMSENPTFATLASRYNREPSDQVVLEVEGSEDTTLVLEMNEKRWSWSLEQLLNDSFLEVYRPEDARVDAVKVKVHSAVSDERYRFHGEWIDRSPDRETDYYYVRVRQTNGQTAWSSPVWITREPK